MQRFFRKIERFQSEQEAKKRLVQIGFISLPSTQNVYQRRADNTFAFVMPCRNGWLVEYNTRI